MVHLTNRWFTVLLIYAFQETSLNQKTTLPPASWTRISPPCYDFSHSTPMIKNSKEFYCLVSMQEKLEKRNAARDLTKRNNVIRKLYEAIIADHQDW